MNQSRPQTPAPTASPETSVACAEAQLRELREQRESMRAEWDTLMSELGNPTMPTDAELERMIRDLPVQDRAELRRFHDETRALNSDYRDEAPQLPQRCTENLHITRHAIRC